MKRRPPGPNERIAEQDGKPTRVMAAFLRDIAADLDRAAKLEAHLIAQGVIVEGWDA